jgi:hypothetical protein
MTAEFIVEFECPQCGGPASLEETCRLFICKYCNVKSYLVPRDVFHYVFADKAPENKEIIYFPFWRLKGILFICSTDFAVHSEPVDYMYQALPSDYFPDSLGFKTQVMKMRFAGPEFKGRIFTPEISLEDIAEQIKHDYVAAYRQAYLTDLAFYHLEFIGITEIIYAPYYIHDKTLYDGISNERIDKFWEGSIAVDEKLMADLPPVAHLRQDVKFIPTLCPHCGWDMECARDSLLLACTNCSSFYKPRQREVKKLGVGFMPGDKDTALYLPFWRLKVTVNEIQLDTYGDLIKIANLAKVVSEEDKQRPFHFWIPAFKIVSKLFLQIATHVTLCQPHGKIEQAMPKVPIYPVNLPISEVLKFPKTLIANFIVFKDIHFPKLQQIGITPQRIALVYLPFQAYGSEFVHPEYRVRVTGKTLEHHRQ